MKTRPDRRVFLLKCQPHFIPHHAAVGGLGNALIYKTQLAVVVQELVLAGQNAALPALGWCVFPYIIPDLLKLALALLLSKRVEKFLK